MTESNLEKQNVSRHTFAFGQMYLKKKLDCFIFLTECVPHSEYLFTNNLTRQVFRELVIVGFFLDECLMYSLYY